MTKEKERIFIGIPCYENVSNQVLEDYMRFAYHIGRRMPDYEFFLGIKSKTEQFRARNALVEAAIGVGAKWLFMLDDDHIIDIDGVTGEPEGGAGCYDFLRILLEHDVDIVGPIYYNRGGECNPVVMRERNGAYFFMNESDLTGGLQEVAVQGGGCMLIKMRIFDNIKQPWFKPEHTYGTDIQLCRNAAKAGFKVYTDSSLQIGHVLESKVIVSSKNKDSFRQDSSQREVMNMASGWQASAILNLYRHDAMIYMNFEEESEFRPLWDNYAAVADVLADKYGRGTKAYYGHMGPEQLGRQVLYHDSEYAKTWLAFLTQAIDMTREQVGLDFGCGSAPFGFALVKRGHKVHFVDIDGGFSYEFLKWRIKRYGFEDRVSYDWPEPGTCQHVIVSDVFEHLADWKYYLAKCVESLRDFGVLLTNYLIMSKDDSGKEHINWERGEFIKHTWELGLHPISSTVFQKRVNERGPAVSDTM